jgi:cytochrome c biogenesis protein
LLNGVILELVQLDREQVQLKRLPEDEKTFAMTTQMLLALSDASFYPAPLVFSLQDFTQVQASVFQVARAPGKYVVYLGCALLIVGIFAMLYVRERRLWIWVTPNIPVNDAMASGAMMALSTNRKTMDSEREFAHLKAKLFGDNLTGS